MSFDHPFSSWAQQSSGLNLNVSSSQAPSTLGALPYPVDPAQMNMTTFYFKSFKPDIFNCVVVNSQSQTVYHLVTNNHLPGYTVIRNAQEKNISLIEWQAQPLIEIAGRVPKQYVKTWLSLNNDKRTRTMIHGDRPYTWMPRDRSIELYAAGSQSPVLMARINRAHGGFSLDMTSHAVQLGLLDSAISTTLLFQCGRNID